MKKAKPQQTQATTSEFHEGTPLVPEELLPLLNLPVFRKGQRGTTSPKLPSRRSSPMAEIHLAHGQCHPR